MSSKAIILATLSMMLLLAGCNGGGAQVEFKLGAVLSLDGQFSQYGTSIRSGMEIALEEANAEGGVNGTPLAVDIRDSGSSVEAAEAAMNELAEAGCDIVIGAETTELTKSLIPIAARDEIILISPSATSPSLRKIRSGGYFFRICPTDDTEALKLADEMPRQHETYPFIKRPFERVVVLVRHDNDYCDGLWAAFSGELYARQQVQYERIVFDHEQLQAEPPEGEDYSEQMQEILSKAREYNIEDERDVEPGAVVIFGFADDVLTLLRAFAREELSLHLYAPSSIDTADFFEQAAEVAEGLVFPRIFDPQKTANPLVESFVERFRARHGVDPDLYAAYGYDVVKLLTLTLRRDDIANYLEEPRNFRLQMNDVRFDGLTGRVDFSQENNEVIKNFRPYRMTEGKAVELNEYEKRVMREKLREAYDVRQRQGANR